MHYLHLAQETMGSNIGNDISEGTCTMKYNPRVNEELVAHEKFAELHPCQDLDTVQGILEIYYRFEQIMKSFRYGQSHIPARGRQPCGLHSGQRSQGLLGRKRSARPA